MEMEQLLLLLFILFCEQEIEEELLAGAFELILLYVLLPSVALVTSGLLAAVVFENLLSMSKVSSCHCISQKATLDASFESSHKLIFSSFGDSVPQNGATFPGPADCHRSANVDIAGGRIGLLSNMRSISSITLLDKRGNS